MDTSLKSSIVKAYALASYNLKSDIRKTYLGMFWWFVDPVLQVTVYWLMITVFRGRGGDFINVAFIGLLTWKWFATSFRQAGSALPRNKSIMQAVYIPKIVFVMQSFFENFFRFICGLLIAVIFYNLRGFHIGSHYFYLLLHAPLIIFCVYSSSLLYSAICPMFPDINKLVSYLLRMGMFVSGAIFDYSRIPEKFHKIYYLNPFSTLIEGMRAIILHGKAPDFSRYPYVIAIFGICFLLGVYLHKKYDMLYPKIMG